MSSSRSCDKFKASSLLEKEASEDRKGRRDTQTNNTAHMTLTRIATATDKTDFESLKSIWGATNGGNTAISRAHSAWVNLFLAKL
jgi:hypothetical protein